MSAKIDIPKDKIEERLPLFSWLNWQLGYEHNRDLLADIKETAEGFDAEGRSFVYHRLFGRRDSVNISPDALVRYDNNIRNHLRAINARRSHPITLRYFQYLAAFYAEVFLDGYFNRPGEMLRSLNEFVEERDFGTPKEAKFFETDLKKLAFWMATGSGKTLIMHLNYRQFLHYNNQLLDNILLITPNEGLSGQHLQEMTASNIPCRRFDLNEIGLTTGSNNTVRVIEITKLVEQKRGGGESVPVEAFQGNNLIFVDEGHKGSGGEMWRRSRDALGEHGFTFEYSATFGQALTAARNNELKAEYGKAIAFDYSYYYFHRDGYGKDFRVLNLVEETTEEATETLLLGNLLSFYEQQCVFAEQAWELQAYKLERPLWVFVGSTVKAVYSKNRRKRSDVLTVIRFLHRVLQNTGGWVIETIEELVKGKSGLVAPDGQDIFADKFPYLRAMECPFEDIYRDILKKVFHAPTAGGLHLCKIRGADGELGLKTSGSQDYFGLIYIGDVNDFKNLVEADNTGITLEDDVLAGSLFNGINGPHTSIEVLIGAKKFMEGWNSWRVSNMGLLNIGRNEGSQIIQLFGRGVRLRGRDASLKRSAALDGSHPDHIGLLETLNIFAVRANYMAHFRSYLEREGVKTEGYIELPLPIRPDMGLLKAGLVVPRLKKGCDFASEQHLLLQPIPEIKVNIDMSLKVQTLASSDHGVETTTSQSGTYQTFPDESLALVDWEQAYLDLLEYKEQKGLDNLSVPPDAPRNIVADPARYRLIADEAVVYPKSFKDVARLQDAVTRILRKYVDVFYRTKREHWESNQMVYQTLDQSDPNLNPSRVGEEQGRYVVSVQRSEHTLIGEIERLIDEGEQLYAEETVELPRIHFDRHLYQPLLVENIMHAEKVKIAPPALNDGEKCLVKDLKEYWLKEKDGRLSGQEVFLLRNLTRGAGVGFFFEGRRFYPDFILWIKEGKQQRIVFLEPHGMLHAEAYKHDEKARLHEQLPKLNREISRRSKLRDVTLDSFIVSATPYEDLRQSYDDGTWDRMKFAQRHILFPECSREYNYIQKIFEGVIF